MTKTFLKSALLVAVVAGATPAFAAPTAFTATANIVKPLTITKSADLDFGTITMGASLASSNVTVAASSGATASCGANLTCSGTSNPAAFSIAGVGTQTVSLTYTSVSSLQLSTDATKTVAFSHNGPATASLTNGVGAFNVGGQITVASTTVPGVYNGNLDVTASYQ